VNTTEYVEYSIYSGDSLIVKLRNISGQSKYQLMNNFDQNKVEFEVTLKEGTKEETLFNGKVEGIKLDGYDMVELKTSHNETLYKLVKVTIGDSDYYIDIINKEVYNSNGTSIAPVRSNIGTTFTYYFEITEENYYAIHTDSENSVTGVQKISINEGSATLVESVIECSKHDGGNKEIYVAFNGAYYLVDFTNPEEPKIVVGEDSYVLNTEYANHYEITINDVEVIGISGIKEDSPIYKLYEALIDTNTEYYSVGEDKVAVNDTTTYVLSGGTDRVYEVTYENMVYRVTFNEPVVQNTPENPGEVEDSPTGEEE
jgi:hypothetical protein